MQHRQVVSFFTFAPRLVKFGSVAALGLSMQGCVSARHYEEARTVAESETAAHGRTRARLEAAVTRIHELEADLQKQEKLLGERESAAAQSKFDTTVAEKEKEAATQLVEQLRSELARTGAHLSSFSREKHELTQTLLLAEQRMQNIEIAGKNLSALVAATRDLSLALGESLEQGGVELGAKDGQVVVGVMADKLFTPNGDALLADGAPVLAAIGKVSASHPALRVIVREPACAPLATLRAARLGQVLRERGVADSRLTLPSAPAAALPQVADDAAAPVDDAESEPADAASDKPARTPDKAAPAALPALDPAAQRYEIAFAL